LFSAQFATRLGKLPNQKKHHAMTPEIREIFIPRLIELMIQDTPLSEFVRVYAESVKDALGNVDDDQLLFSTAKSNYAFLLDEFGLTVPENLAPPSSVTVAEREQAAAEEIAPAKKTRTSRKKTAAAV
jgi:hypothetical protein